MLSTANSRGEPFSLEVSLEDCVVTIDWAVPLRRGPPVNA
jgi:hypothetical protein